jgi:predicted transcriptional regulator
MTPQRIKYQILEAIRALRGDDDSSTIADTQVAEKTQIDLKTVRDYMELLVADGDLVDASDSGGHAGVLTAQGRIALGEMAHRASTPDDRMTPAEIRQVILQTINGKKPNPGIAVQDSVIAEKMGLSVQEAQDHLEILEQQGKVTLAITTGGHGAWLTLRGRLDLQQQPIKGPIINMSNEPDITNRRVILAAIHRGQGQSVSDSEIEAVTGIKLYVVRYYLDLMKDEDLVIFWTNRSSLMGLSAQN